jgi:hypothetical protein
MSNIVGCLNDDGIAAKEYYSYVNDNYPNEGIYQYFNGIYYSLVMKNPSQAEIHFQKALLCLNDNPRVLERYIIEYNSLHSLYQLCYFLCSISVTRNKEIFKEFNS